MPANPFSKNLREPKTKRPKMKGGTAKEAPTGPEIPAKQLGGAQSPGNARPGTITPGTVQPSEVTLPNVMRPILELDDYTFDGQQRGERSTKTSKIPWHEPDDPAVLRRMFGVNIND